MEEALGLFDDYRVVYYQPRTKSDCARAMHMAVDLEFAVTLDHHRMRVVDPKPWDAQPCMPMLELDSPLALEQSNIIVRDMPRSLAFYRLLGVSIDEVPVEWTEWAPHHVGGRSGFSAFHVECYLQCPLATARRSRHWCRPRSYPRKDRRGKRPSPHRRKGCASP